MESNLCQSVPFPNFDGNREFVLLCESAHMRFDVPNAKIPLPRLHDVCQEVKLHFLRVLASRDWKYIWPRLSEASLFGFIELDSGLPGFLMGNPSRMEMMGSLECYQSENLRDAPSQNQAAAMALIESTPFQIFD
jgi:hypothetical protein